VEGHASPRVLFAPSALGHGSGGGERVDPVVPSAGHFQLGVEEWASTSRLWLSGEFDLAVVGRVEDALERIFQAPRPKQVVVDLRELTFLDAAGLGTIFQANQRARDAAVELLVVRPRGLVNRIFTLTRAGVELSIVDRPALTEHTSHGPVTR
jgi:anti-sigma B factor antagonist